jgi:hypothetical protein
VILAGDVISPPRSPGEFQTLIARERRGICAHRSTERVGVETRVTGPREREKRSHIGRARRIHAERKAIPILQPGRPLPRAAHPRARYGPAWLAHFAFSLSVVVVSFSFLFSEIL